MKKSLLRVGTLCLLACLVITQPLFAISLVPDPATAPATQPNDPAATTVMQNAMKEFTSLSRKERKERLKDVKKELKQYKKDKKEGKADPSTNTLLLVILAILLPPLAVFLHEGEINGKFWIDLLLTLLFYIPGLIYALIVILGK